MRRLVVLGLLAALLPLVSLPAAQADDAACAKQLEAKAASVVALKIVLKFGDNEYPADRTGIVVDPSGVVMSTALGNFRGNAKIQSARVVFPGEEKEYDAVLGAFDTKLGLAFFRIKDLAGKKIASINPADTAEVAIGDELFGVSRVEEGFDYAPLYGTARVVGQVTKPRTMWLFSGTFGALAHPMYNAAGKVVGIVIQQQGIAEGRAGSRTFLLPMSAAQGVIAQAVKASAKALEDAQAKEKEDSAAAKPKEGGPAMDGDAAPMDGGDAPKEGEGGAPAGMADGK